MFVVRGILAYDLAARTSAQQLQQAELTLRRLSQGLCCAVVVRSYGQPAAMAKWTCAFLTARDVKYAVAVTKDD